MSRLLGQSLTCRFPFLLVCSVVFKHSTHLILLIVLQGTNKLQFTQAVVSGEGGYTLQLLDINYSPVGEGKTRHISKGQGGRYVIPDALPSNQRFWLALKADDEGDAVKKWKILRDLNTALSNPIPDTDPVSPWSQCTFSGKGDKHHFEVIMQLQLDSSHNVVAVNPDVNTAVLRVADVQKKSAWKCFSCIFGSDSEPEWEHIVLRSVTLKAIRVPLRITMKTPGLLTHKYILKRYKRGDWLMYDVTQRDTADMKIECEAATS